MGCVTARVCVCVCKSLTKKSRGGHGPVTTGHHDADPRLNEGHGEVNDLRPLLVNGERAHGHEGFLRDDLQVSGGRK